MNRFKGLLAAVILVIVVYSAAWFAGAFYVRAEIERALDETQTGNDRFTCADLAVAGFPFRYDITCAQLTYMAGDLTVTVPEIKGTVRVYNPAHALLFVEGPAEIADAFTGSRREMSWSSLSASARTNGWALARVSAVADDIVLADALAGTTQLMRIGHAEAHVLDSPELYDAETGLAELALYARLDAGGFDELGIEDADMRFEATVPGVPDDIRRWTPQTLAANWRDRAIELVRFEAGDARASLEATGRMTTNGDATFEGDFDLESDNLHETLEPLVAPALLDLVLGDANQDGTRYRAYAVRRGVVMAGNIPLATLPPLY